MCTVCMHIYIVFLCVDMLTCVHMHSCVYVWLYSSVLIYIDVCTCIVCVCVCVCVGAQKKDQILATFKPLQKSIGQCMQCTNNKIIRCVHSLLSRLTSHFPTEACSSNVASKYEELENLYATVSKVIYEGLTNYEKWGAVGMSGLGVGVVCVWFGWGVCVCMVWM